jgi:eukaryotic-like serine/threonine-protein kinase
MDADHTDNGEVELLAPQSLVPVPTKYRLLASLGRGGMGDVFLAESKGFAGSSKLVVVKRLRAGLSADPQFLSMFLDEGKLAVKLNHPNVVHSHEVGMDGSGNYFIAMEFLEGQPYSRLLRRAAQVKQPLTLAQHVTILMATLDGLHYAHELTDVDQSHFRIVHRDVSPQNVFVTYEGGCKVLDFGIAKAIGSTVDTQAGVVKGKLGFMSPEQVIGEGFDRRADIFGVGVMLFMAITGKSPWEGLANLEIARRLINGKIPVLGSSHSAAPEILNAICNRALAASPNDRFASAKEMRVALESTLEALPTKSNLHDIAEVTASLFAEERKRMQRSIETQLKSVDATVPVDAHASLPTIDGVSSVSALTAMPNGSTTSTARGYTPAPRSLWPIVLVMLLLGSILLSVALFSLTQRTPALTATVPTSAPLVPSKTLEITVEPADARLRVNGAEVETPFVSTRSPDGLQYELRASAEGYLPAIKIIHFDGVKRVHLALKPQPANEAIESGPIAPIETAKSAETKPVSAKPKASRRNARKAVSTSTEEKSSAKPRVDILDDPKVDIIE